MAYSLFACADDQAAARAVAADALRRALVPGIEAHLAGLDFAAELMTRTSGKAGAGVLDDRWTEKLTVSGTPGDCAARISALHAAGADSICLVPTGDHDQFFAASREVREALDALQGAHR